MEIDHRTRLALANSAVTADGTPVPGKRTRSESLVVQRCEGAALPGAESDTRAAVPSAPSPFQATASDRSLPAVQMRVDSRPAEGTAQVRAAATRGTATPVTRLPHGDLIQRAFGRHDISGIQAHVGGDAAASARAMGAQAYATGDHVVLGEGVDLHTVAHEAAHVIQQRGGVQLKGGVGAAGDPHEQHADAVAARVTAGQSAESLLDQCAGPAVRPGAIQRRIKKGDGSFFEDIEEVIKQLGMTVSEEQRNNLQRMMDSKERDYTLEEVGQALQGRGGSSPSPSILPSSGSLPSVPPSSTYDIYLKGPGGKKATFTVLPEHAQDALRFRKALAEKLQLPEHLAPNLVVYYGTKYYTTSSDIPKDVDVQVSVSMHPVKMGSSTSGMQQTGPSVDQELQDLVQQLQPDATIPCSHIDDNHIRDPDSKMVGEKDVPVEGGMERIKRFLSVREIEHQQALSRVETAIKSKEKFTLVLIDPGFDETSANHRHMLQIVEYLKGNGCKFLTETKARGKHKAEIHKVLYAQVSIVYITAKVHGEKLPNAEKFGGEKL